MSNDQVLTTQYSALFVKGAILLSTFILSVLFACSPWGKHLELLCYDTLFLVRGPKPPAKQVVVVAIDEASFGAFEQRWPWPRHLHAELLDTLFREGARVVAIDALFAEISEPEDDMILSRTVQTHSGVVMAAALELVDAPAYLQGTVVYPLPSLISESTHVGIINLPLDSDGFVRKTFLSYGDVPSISLAAAKAFLSSKGKDLSHEYESANNEIMVNYAGSPRSIPTVSYYQALDPEHYLPKNFFRDKLVFIGLSLLTTPEVDTPVSDHFFFPYSREGANVISGVEIQATIAGNLLTGNSIRPLSRTLIWSGFIWGAGFGLLVFCRPVRAIVATGCLTGLVLLMIYYLFFSRNIYMPPFFSILPLFAGCVVLPAPYLFKMRKDRKYIRDTFAKYVSPKVVEKLLEDPSQVRLGGHMVNASVLYLDIAGFSRMAADMKPDRLVSELSRYLGHFTETIFKWDGMVDKYVGDAIMAIWGAPLPQVDHAVLACRASLEIRRNLNMLLPEDSKLSGADMDIRIGINSGDMLAGNVGGQHFLNYTVHGDATNFAVRLEALNKQYGTHILIGRETVEQIGDEFVVREIDRIRMDGSASNEVLYELIGFSSDADEALQRRVRMFETARRQYLNKDFVAASDGFSQILSRDDTDGPSRVYMERCRQYQKTPPPDNWDGVKDIKLK